MGDDQRGPLHGLDDVGHTEGLTCAGSSQQGLMLVSFLQALDEFGDGLWLIASGLEVCHQSEVGHEGGLHRIPS